MTSLFLLWRYSLSFKDVSGESKNMDFRFEPLQNSYKMPG